MSPPIWIKLDNIVYKPWFGCEQIDTRKLETMGEANQPGVAALKLDHYLGKYL